MSAPTSRDPLVVNTRDGVVWQRRAVTAEGRGLYAVTGSCSCPEFLMATLAELAEHGIAGSADVLPMSVDPQPRTLDQVEDELTGVSLSLYEEELETARLRLALKSAQRGRRDLRSDVEFLVSSRKRWRDAEIASREEVKSLRARVAMLDAERHTTNEALDDAVQALRARNEADATEVFVPRTEMQRWVDIADALNAAHDAGMPVGIDLDGTLTDHNAWSVVWDRTAERWTVAGYEDAPPVEESADRLTGSFAPVAALREGVEAEAVRRSVDAQFPVVAAFLAEERVATEDPHDSPLHQTHRIGRDLPESGGAL